MRRPITAQRSKTNRSRVTNGAEILPGIDGRTPAARRYRDIVHALTVELGGEVGEAEALQVRSAAAAQIHAEQMAAAVVRGEPVDPEQLTRATNGAIRALEALRRRKVPSRAKKGRTVRDYLASKVAAE